jgi:FHS family L-fucose permease-like MFS transporter
MDTIKAVALQPRPEHEPHAPDHPGNDPIRCKSLFRGANGKDYTVTFVLVSSLFLLWGCCNGLIDVLNKHFQNSLHVTKAQSAFVQFANYMGYFLMALPAGWVARRFGYKSGIITGLILVATGAFGFVPATTIGSYWAFLLALFVLASGLACLETIANPYTTVLGSPEEGASRINLAQFCGGIGWMLGPLIGGLFVFTATGEINTSNEAVHLPYLIIGIVVAVLAVVFFFAEVPDLHGEYKYRDKQTATASLWSHPHFVWGVVAQFCYVAAQTGIFSFFINYIVVAMPRLSAGVAGLLPATWSFEQEGIIRVTERGASQMLAFGGFGLVLTGRLVGAMLMRKEPPRTMLARFGVMGVVSMMLVMVPWGWISVVALFVNFFAMSLMFPTIFALGIHGLGELTKKASSFMIMSIVGGAIMPILMGWIADHHSMRLAFAMPLGCFVVIALYAARWKRLSQFVEPHASISS